MNDEGHMRGLTIVIVTLILAMTVSQPVKGSDSPTIAELEDSLRAAETAFAQTMADRDLDAFAAFLAEDAIFSTPRGVLRGRSEIIEGWKPLYEGPDAPFSWRPARVHVLANGSIGGTTGPVYDPDGNVIGQFVSTWQRQPDGAWRIILDLAPGTE